MLCTYSTVYNIHVIGSGEVNKNKNCSFTLGNDILSCRSPGLARPEGDRRTSIRFPHLQQLLHIMHIMHLMHLIHFIHFINLMRLMHLMHLMHLLHLLNILHLLHLMRLLHLLHLMHLMHLVHLLNILHLLHLMRLMHLLHLMHLVHLMRLLHLLHLTYLLNLPHLMHLLHLLHLRHILQLLHLMHHLHLRAPLASPSTSAPPLASEPSNSSRMTLACSPTYISSIASCNLVRKYSQISCTSVRSLPLSLHILHSYITGTSKPPSYI
jgi:hypothetical protein